MPGLHLHHTAERELAMPINLNEAQEYREMGAMMPDGAFVWIKGHIRHDQQQAYSLPGFPPEDNGIFKKGRENDTYYTDWEFTVVFGPHTGSKLFQNMTIAGGQMDDKGQSKAGNITKSFYRGWVESAYGILPTDQSAQAQAARNIPSLSALQEIPFAVKVGIQAGEPRPASAGGGVYPDRNFIQKIVLPDDPIWARMKAGEIVPPEPSGTRPARGGGSGPAAAGSTEGAPLWQQQAATAAAAPVAAPAPAQAALPQPGPAAVAGPMPATAPVAAPAPIATPAPAAAVAAAWGGQPQPGPVNGAAGPVAAPAAAPAAPPTGGPAWLSNQGG
jgi:hypothetical protein